MLKLFTVLVVIVLAATSVPGAPPSPRTIERWRSEGVLEERLARWKAIDVPPVPDEQLAVQLGLGSEIPDTFSVVVIMVDFDDNTATVGTTANINSLLLSKGQRALGSLTDYFIENSYGSLFVRGVVLGWYRMDSSWAYYLGDGWTGNARQLAGDAILAADADVDFSQYCERVPGVINGVIVVHAGPSTAPDGTGIPPHQGFITSEIEVDGVRPWAYTMNPELQFEGVLSTIGVYCHELAHVLGLPDLYDLDGLPSCGTTGTWSLMSSGAHNGTALDGDSPSYLDPWSKIELGFLEPILVDTVVKGLFDVVIPPVEVEPAVYKLWHEGLTDRPEYWLVENRQPISFDRGLPGYGLLIYHIDEGKYNNNNPLRLMVGVEQADGLYEMNAMGDDAHGDAGDPYPGDTDNRFFHTLTVPNSRTNFDATWSKDSLVSQVGVWNISDSDSLMTADLEAVYVHPYLLLCEGDSLILDDSAPGGDGDGWLEAGETISFYCRVSNLMGESFDPIVALSSDAPEVQFVEPEVSFGLSSLDPTAPCLESTIPVTFSLPYDLEPTNVIFTLEIGSDRLEHADGVCDRDFVHSIEFETVLGKPDMLIVDGDNGAAWDQRYRQGLTNLSEAYAVWDLNAGAPSGSDLLQFGMVIWLTGAPDTGLPLTPDNVTALTEYLDGGGSLFLSSYTAADTLASIAPDFLSGYLHCAIDGTVGFANELRGIDGNPVGQETVFHCDGNTGLPTSFTGLAPVGEGQGAFCLAFNDSLGVGAVSYEGDYSTLLLSFPVEMIHCEWSGYDNIDTMLARVIAFLDGSATAVGDGDQPVTVPTDFVLYQNRPNPFNPSTEISYTVTSSEQDRHQHVELKVFNVLGREVRTLVDGYRPPGEHTVVWDGTDDRGRAVASGVYLYRLTQADRAQAKKMILLK